MPDFDYDAYKEKLKLQKQQWAEDLVKEREKRETYRHKNALFDSRLLFIYFVLLLFLPVTSKLYDMISFLCFFEAIVFLVESVLISSEKLTTNAVIIVLVAIIVFIQILGPSSELLTRIGTGICDACAVLGIILSIYLMKYFETFADS